MNKSTLVFALAMSLTGCATTPAIQPVNPMDRHLTCDQLQVELDNINAVIKNARADKGANSANVASALLFWPALVGTNVQASGTLKSAYYRRDHLSALMMDKKCEV